MTNMRKHYPKPWEVHRIAGEQGYFEYEIRAANYELVCVLDETDFIPDEGDEGRGIGEAKMLADLITEMINRHALLPYAR